MKLMVVVEGLATPYEPGVFQRPQPVDRTSGPRAVAQRPKPESDRVPPGPRSEAAEAYEEAAHPEHRPRKALIARDLMTSPVTTISPKAQVGEAHKLFSKHRFRHLPVSSDGQRLEGILSDRDILSAESKGMGRAVSEIMHRQVLVASPDTDIRTIAGIFFEERIGAMPIVDEQADLVGILTRTDILRALMNRAPLDIWI